MRQESVHHSLGVAIRIVDHFLRAPIPDELDVRLGTHIRPARTQLGTGIRFDDGTYRFIDVDDGAHQLQVTADERWMLLDPLPVIVTPVGQPTVAMEIEAWPSPVQATPLGVTSVRGSLVGSSGVTIGMRVDMDVAGIDSGHHTQTGSTREFLFLLPGRLELDADGLVDLTLWVTGAAVTGGQIEQTTFSGATFKVVPGRETRVRFFVT